MQEFYHKKLLYRLLLFACLNILLYLLYDLHIKSYETIYIILGSLVLYGGFAVALRLGVSVVHIRNLLMAVSFFSMVMSFMYLGGFSKIAVLDFLNTGLMVVLLYKARVRILLSLLFVGIIFALLCMVYFYPNVIVSSRANDPLWLDAMSFCFRLAIGVSITWVVKEELETKSEQLQENFLQLDDLHSKISKQYEDLKKLNSEVLQLNQELEYRVQLRTQELKNKNKQLTAFTYVNSHLLRAPISKLLSIQNYIRISSDIDDTKMIIRSFDKTLDELDQICRKINDTIEKDLEYNLEEIEEIWKDFQKTFPENGLSKTLL